MPIQTVCLNMIVKNESHIIKETLSKLYNKITFDYYVISDTGSTDNTKEIIKNFFNDKNIRGEIYDDVWEDFATNRTKALEHASGKADYLLIFDADDEIYGNFSLPEILDKDGYLFKFGDNNVYYERVLLINNKKTWKYYSVIHEYITCISDPSFSKCTLQGDYYVISGRKGARSMDPNKYLNDALVLEKAWKSIDKTNDLHLRYAFYCANSYKDAGIPEKAIEWYKITLSQNNWNQEKYMSCIGIYDMYVRLNQKEHGFYYLIEASIYDHERPEWVYPLIEHYCSRNKDSIAYSYYLRIKDVYDNNINVNLSSKLFLNTSMYYYYIPYFMIIVSARTKQYSTGIKMYEILFRKKFKINDGFKVKCSIINLQFLIDNVQEDFKNEFYNLAKEYFQFVYDNNICNLDEINNELIMYDQKYNITDPRKLHIVKFTKEQCKQSTNILIHTGYMNFLWNLTYSKQNALGGSEKAVCYIAENLSKILPENWHIYVTGEVLSETVNNITFVHISNINNLEIPFHTLIISRFISFYELYPKICYFQSIIWAHDTTLREVGCHISSQQIVTKRLDSIKACVCLTDWHKNEFIKLYPNLTEKLTLNNNGIDIDVFPKNIQKVKNSFIYSSRPERGLYILLNIWPKILEILPDATLNIASYCDFPTNNIEYQMKSIIDSYDNITHLGKLGVDELYNLMAKSEYWLFPSSYPETSCITAMEMMMSGVICIYYPLAGLTDTMNGNGLKMEQGKELETLLSICYDENKKNNIRESSKKYASECSWYNRALKWKDLIFNEKFQLQQYLTTNPRFGIPKDHINYLNTLKDLDFKVIYDIGSATMSWTKEVKKIWSESDVICFDATENMEFIYKNANIKYNLGVISDVDGKTVRFYENDTLPTGNSYYKEIGSKDSENVYPENNYKELTAKTLETIVKERNFPLPDLVKIDVQGSELDILKGGLSVINNAKMLIIELQSEQYNRGAPLANVTISFLEDNGWQLKDSKFCDNGADADYCFVRKPDYSVKLLWNWSEPEKIREHFSNMCDFDFRYKNIEFVTSEKADYYVIINHPRSEDYFEPEKTIIFHGESSEGGAKNWGEYYIPDDTKFLSVNTYDKTIGLVQWYFNEKPSKLLKNIEDKNLVLSTIVSSKCYFPGHKKRLDFIKYIEQKDLNLDIYGYDNNYNFKNYRRSLDDKGQGLFPYKYYFMGENHIQENYITEKMWEPIIAECFVFYYGAPNVSDYIDSRCFVQLNLENFEEDYNKIIESINNNSWEKALPYIREAKKKIISEYGVFPRIKSIIDK